MAKGSGKISNLSKMSTGNGQPAKSLGTSGGSANRVSPEARSAGMSFSAKGVSGGKSSGTGNRF